MEGIGRGMDSHTYHFVSRWQVEGTCGEVADVIGDPLALPRWWPSVYLRAEQLEPPDARGVGRRVALQTKGWLPYTLHWQSVVVESRYPYGFTLTAEGDLAGAGVWTFEQEGHLVNITYDWRIRAEKPLVRSLSFLLKPLFEWNHRWAMTQGEKSLALELRRRRSPSAAAWSQIPAPPGPVTYTGVALIAGAVAVGASLAYLMIKARRRS
jgi:hypothetical protein